MQVPNRHADGFVKFEQLHKSHNGDVVKAGLSARRVVNAAGGEEVQITMSVIKHHARVGRQNIMCSHIDLTPQEASALIAALAKPWNEQPTNKKEKINA